MIVLTKTDLSESVSEKVEYSQIQEKVKQHGFQGSRKTSSKEWEDQNIYKAFEATLVTAYMWKYGVQDSEDD